MSILILFFRLFCTGTDNFPQNRKIQLNLKRLKKANEETIGDALSSEHFKSLIVANESLIETSKRSGMKKGTK